MPMFNVSTNRPSIWPKGIYFYRVEIHCLGFPNNVFFIETLYPVWGKDPLKQVRFIAKEDPEQILLINYIENSSLQ